MKTLMAQEKLPRELEEEILARTHPFSLSRFRTVCKRWNTLFNDKRFANNNLHLAACLRPEFMIQQNSKIYSVSVNLEKDNPVVMKRELNLDNLAGLEPHIYPSLSYHNGFVLRNTSNNIGGALILWNPLLKQTRWIEKHATKNYALCGIGYDSRKPEKSYKIIGHYHPSIRGLRTKERFAIYEFATSAWKYIDAPYIETCRLSHRSVSLNGNLYWITYSYCDNTYEFSIECFDCSREIVKHFCDLPCKKSNRYRLHYLGVFKGDRLSLLKKCKRSGKIKVWVTKNKIDHDSGGAPVWMMFMTVSIRYLREGYYFNPRYFIEEINGNKSLVMCYADASDKACVCIVKGDVCETIDLYYDVSPNDGCIINYIPSLIPIPLGHRYWN